MRRTRWDNFDTERLRSTKNFSKTSLSNILVEELGYEHLYGPDVERTDDRYRDVFLPRGLSDALQRINPALSRAAVEEAVRKLSDVNASSLEQQNEIFRLFAIKKGLHLSRDRVNGSPAHGSLVSVAVCFNELTFALTNVIICLLQFERGDNDGCQHFDDSP